MLRRSLLTPGGIRSLARHLRALRGGSSICPIRQPTPGSSGSTIKRGMPSLAVDCHYAPADVDRESPASEILRQAFRWVRRAQRLCGGTVSLEGRRFQTLSRFPQSRTCSAVIEGRSFRLLALFSGKGAAASEGVADVRLLPNVAGRSAQATAALRKRNERQEPTGL